MNSKHSGGSAVLSAARLEYVLGTETPDGRIFPSLEDLAQKYNVPLITLKRLAAREGWHRERFETYEKYYQELKERTLRELTENAVSFRKSLYEGAAIAVDLICERLKLMQKDWRENPKHSKIRGYELRDIGSALEAFKRVGQEALGDKLTDDYTWKDLIYAAKNKNRAIPRGQREKRKK